jgi:hypothetical protein
MVHKYIVVVYQICTSLAFRCDAKENYTNLLQCIFTYLSVWVATRQQFGEMFS